MDKLLHCCNLIAEKLHLPHCGYTSIESGEFMITWKDTFGIIKKMFNINQSQIASFLGVQKDTITKIQKGNLNSTPTNEDIYRKIFNPNTPNNPAKDTEKYLLSLLEEIIEKEFKEVRETMKDCWVEDDKYIIGDYEKFVMKMLERTIYISSSKGKTALPDINNATDPSMDSGGAQLSIPDKYKMCLFCTRWNGNASDALKIKTGVYGTCLMYNRDQISTGGTDCKDYKANDVRISSRMLSRR